MRRKWEGGKARRRRFELVARAGVLAVLLCDPAPAQNVVDETGGEAVLPSIEISGAQLAEFLETIPKLARASDDAESRRIAQKLDRHVTEFLDGFPWRALHHTLGISGYESHFAHPDEMFLSLSLALPCLPSETARRTKAFLAAQLAEAPPYAVEGFERTAGRPRERYEVPEALRVPGRATARHALGVYSFWLYCHLAPDEAAAKAHWPAVRARMQPLLSGDYPFDPDKRDYVGDEAETLNGNIAGLLGMWRLASMAGDEESVEAARLRAGELLALRINLERRNPRFVERTRTANRSLHVFKLARYCSLVPEVGEAVRRHSGGLAERRLREFRTARPAWWMAFGDRFIGGENYTNPLHFSRALFAGATLIESLPADELAGYVDVPWGAGDFSFIEKCAHALQRSPSAPQR